jgi:hypothetical protein
MVKWTRNIQYVNSQLCSKTPWIQANGWHPPSTGPQWTEWRHHWSTLWETQSQIRPLTTSPSQVYPFLATRLYINAKFIRNFRLRALHWIIHLSPFRLRALHWIIHLSPAGIFLDGG